MNLKSKVQQSHWGILIFLSVLWGCSFILIKKALIAFDPVQLGCLRLGISSLAFAPMVWWHRRDIEWKMLPLFIAVGLTGSGLPAFLFAYAQTEVSSSLAGLLNSLTPIWTLIIGIFLFRLNFSNLKLIGVVIGFFGAGMLILMGNGGLSGGIQWQSLLIVAATICYGSSVNMVQAFFGHTKPVIISSMSFFVLGIPALIWLFTTDFLHVMAHDPQAKWSLGAVTILSLFGTVLASMIFYYLVQKTSAVFGSTVTYLMPVVALAWGILDGETISMLHIAGLCLILVGVYFTKKS
ncbi:MAG: DMT family transporter [Saprospiraceae bacterium]|nr:DMT family transporter [Saprospiraceae bacterium]